MGYDNLRMPICVRRPYRKSAKVCTFSNPSFSLINHYKLLIFLVRILCTGDFIFSSSYDKTIKAWLFDTSELDEGSEDKACIRTFKGHSKGVYPLIFIPAEESLVLQNEDGPVINPGDLLISGKLKI